MKLNNIKRPLIRVAEYARMCGISTTAVNNQIVKKQLPHRIIDGVRYVPTPTTETIKKYMS